MDAFASVLPAGSGRTKTTASILAVAATGTMFCLAGNLPVSSPIEMPGYGPQKILYVMLGDPATTFCGIWDGVDANGSPISGALYCNGDRVPPDDPRFPRARRAKAWI
ncbi:MAG TPA: hypothetical protein VG889_20700 [Rhizomicrobium sp.]|nr:hypothetical protein [Rhizomicrobium sp.]